MTDESANLRFILEKILEIEDSSKRAVIEINITEKPDWKLQDIDDIIRFQSKWANRLKARTVMYI